MTYHVTIMASRMAGTLYIGVTSNLVKRIAEHKSGTNLGFTSQYKVHRLVYYENYDQPEVAITREKELKKWRRMWKIQLIEKMNPKWDDLFTAITG